MRSLPSLSRLFALILIAVATSATAETLDIRVATVEVDGVSPPSVVEVTISAEPGDLEETRSVKVPGRAVFDVAAGAVVRVGVDAAGWWAPAEVVRVDSRTEALLRLRPTGWIAGRFLVPEGEAAPEEVEARMRSAAGSAGELPESRWRCPVEEERFRCEAPAGVLDVRLRAKSYVSHFVWSLDVPPHETASVGVLELRAGASVVGWVEAPSRHFRFEEVEVRLQPLAAGLAETSADHRRIASLQREASVNARGFFEIVGLAPGSYALVVEHPDYAPARIASAPVYDRAETEIHRVALQRAVALEARLDPPTAPFRRRWHVELLRPGEAPGHLEIVAEGPASEEGRWQTDRLAPGQYELRVGDERGARWVSQDVTVAEGLPPVEVSLPYDRLEGTLRLGGEPLAASLYFGGRFGARRVAIPSDEEGKFYVILPRQDEPWNVEFVAPAIGLEAFVGGIEVRKSPGEPWAKVEIDLPDNRVSGGVVDESGAPISKVLVEAVAAEDGARPTSTRSSEPDGSFELRGLEEGRYLLEARHSRRGRRLSADRVSVEVDEDREAEAIRLVLRENSLLDGQVVSPMGLGVPGAQVLARLDKSERSLIGVMPSATTDADGVFQLSLPQGTGRMILSVMAPGFALKSLVLDARDGEALLIELEQTSGTLVVTYDGGRNVRPGLRRHRTDLFHPHLIAPSGALRQWAEVHGELQEDTERYVIPMLEPGAYTVCYDVGFAVISTGWLPHGGFAGRCASGVLAAFGELHLTLPVPGEETSASAAPPD